VVGHECGHIAAKHMEYHTLAAVLLDTVSDFLGPLGRIIGQTAGLPLRAWARRSEVTSDRAGLLCCGDIRVAERALLHLVTGLADVERVDVDDYLRKYKEVEALHGHVWQQAFSTHPLIPKRIEALRLFAESELYYSLSGKAPPPGARLLEREELDRRVNAIVKP
jgi:Zn-dependent protease with chaperone function